MDGRKGKNPDCPDPKNPGGDDGRTIADMSRVEIGMLDIIAPQGLRHILSGRHPGKKEAPHIPSGTIGLPAAPLDLTPGETRALLKASLKAALLISGIFIAGAAIFILFAIHVWFK